MKIKTNHHRRELLDSHEVPKNIIKNDFDWLDEDDTTGFIHYKKTWYHLSQFVRVEKNTNLDILGYSGIHGETYFSGIIIKLFDNDTISISSYYI